MSDATNNAASSDGASPASAFVRAHLWQEPLHPEDETLWKSLLADEDNLKNWFRQTGLELVIDKTEGYAFLRQIEPRAMKKCRVSSANNSSAMLPRCCSVYAR